MASGAYQTTPSSSPSKNQTSTPVTTVHAANALTVLNSVTMRRAPNKNFGCGVRQVWPLQQPAALEKFSAAAPPPLGVATSAAMAPLVPAANATQR